MTTGHEIPVMTERGRSMSGVPWLAYCHHDQTLWMDGCSYVQIFYLLKPQMLILP